MKHTTQKITNFALGIIVASALSSQANAQSTNSPAQTSWIKDQLGELAPKNVTLNSGFHSKYLGTYGFTLSDGPVITSDLSFSVGRLNYDFWNNYDLNKGWTEADHTFSTAIETKYLTLKPDAIVFSSPTKAFPTSVTLGLGLHSKGLPLDLSLYGAHAIGEGTYDGQLFQFRAAKNIPLTPISTRLSLSLETRATYNNSYFVDGRGFTTVAGGASLNYNLGKGFSASAGTRFQKAFKSLGGTFKDNSVFEFGLTKKF
ncbi:MAG: hypothetical protein AABX11_02375 [Nanoarchaeota archaeon]